MKLSMYAMGMYTFVYVEWTTCHEQENFNLRELKQKKYEKRACNTYVELYKHVSALRYFVY